MLPIVLDPSGAPSVFGKSVDATPRRNDDAVEELLRPSCPLQPQLADQEQDGENNSVRDESAAHDEVGKALAQVIALAETQGGNTAKEHLGPREDWQGLAIDAMKQPDERADATVNAILQV